MIEHGFSGLPRLSIPMTSPRQNGRRVAFVSQPRYAKSFRLGWK